MFLRRMAFVFVQMLSALLFSNFCVCKTADDLVSGNVAVAFAHQLDTVKKESKALEDVATETRLGVKSPTSSYLVAKENNQDLIKFRIAGFQTQAVIGNQQGNKANRRKRAIIFVRRVNITDTVNDLRSFVGASNMNYLTYSRPLEDDVANWTSHCDYDAAIYSRTDSHWLRAASSLPIEPVTQLKTDFNSSYFYYTLRSVELRSVAAAYTLCSVFRINGTNYTNIYLTAYALSITGYFNSRVQQYSLGEACTTCQSGSYWCNQGLCKDDCSASDSNCFCNSYCLNCAITNSTTCTCECLKGWTGPRCEIRDNINATTPSCLTTSRVPFTWTTTGTTTTTKPTVSTTTTKRTITTTNGVATIGQPMIQLFLYATMLLFLGLFIDKRVY